MELVLSHDFLLQYCCKNRTLMNGLCVNDMWKGIILHVCHLRRTFLSMRQDKIVSFGLEKVLHLLRNRMVLHTHT
jgi:hypothetical protein